MRPEAEKVKPRRAYDATRRREQASRNRAKMIDTAERLFLEVGYATTTVATIAAESGVSVDSVYKTFGGKPGLIRAIRNRALKGDQPVTAERRSDRIQLSENDPREILQSWGAFVAELAPRAAPILLLVRDAAVSHLEVRALRDELDADRHARMTTNARRLRDRGHLRPGVSLARAADVLWTYSSPELYELLVLRRGWSPARYGRFVAESMIAALL